MLKQVFFFRKLGIFDTGISDDYLYENPNVVKVFDLTEDLITFGKDINGHGTFVTSLLYSKNEKCPGILPNAQIYVFKVFT